MKAVILDGPGVIAVREIAMPEMGRYQALVRMVAAGICSGTDRKLFRADPPFAPDYPSVLGHEAVGCVIAIGKGVRNFAIGDRVLRPCAVYPGTRHDGVGSSWGGFAEYGLVTDHEAWLLESPQDRAVVPGYAKMQQKVPVWLDDESAVLLITWKETYSVLRDAGDLAGKAVAILGDGAVGLSFAYWARLLGASPIEVVGRRDFRLERALRLGADSSVRAPGDGTYSGGRDFDLIVDTIGNDESLARSLPRLRDYGRILAYGIGSTFETRFDRSLGPVRWSYVQANPNEAAVHDEVLEVLKSHPCNPADWVTKRISIDDILAAFKHLEEPASLKALIRFS
jgi:2-desacetyl-2-hydroxyethyl bacteriochlorophyllide A dehydrogenase